MEVKVMSQDPAARTIPLFDPNSEQARRALGMLIAEMSGGKKELPLAGVDIIAKVADRIADVTVKQKFRNTFTDHMEAVYIFPLAHSAVVTAFELRVGKRTVKGEVKERQEARRDYQTALTEGKRSALMEQERDDVFTMQVGNIAPGEEVTVEIKYAERLAYFEDGTCEIRLPLVVAPRYISGAPKGGNSTGWGVEVDTDEVPDASRITPPRLVTGSKDNVQLSVTVELLQSGNGLLEIKDLASTQHVVSTSLGEGGVKVELSKENEVMDRDFIIKWVLADKNLKPNLVSYTDAKGETYCMLTVFSPKQDKFLGVPRDVIFVVDRSGSMSGSKMASAAKSCSILLDTLGPQDRFAICAFDNVNEWLQPHQEWSSRIDGRFIGADEEGIESGKAYLRTVTARGGTELDMALAESLGELRNRTKKEGSGIIVILTDGQVGNESGVYSRLQTELGDARIFTVGIDTAVNGGILSRMATLGGGTSALVTPGAKLEKALSQIGREIGVPVLTGLKLEASHGKLDSETITPAHLPDLFRGRASTIFFKMSSGMLTGKGKKKITIKGVRADGSPYSVEVTEKCIALPAISSLYARSLIRDLEDNYREESHDRNKLKKRMIETSLAHSILCRFTAFIAVDHAEVVNKDGGRRTVVQPVHQPSEWEEHASGASARGRLMQRSVGSLPAGGYGAANFGAFGAPTERFGMAAPQQPGASLPPAAQAPPSPTSQSGGDAWGSNTSTGSWGAAPGGAQQPSTGWGSPPETLAESIRKKIAESTAPQSCWGMGDVKDELSDCKAAQTPVSAELIEATKNLMVMFGAVVKQFAIANNADSMDWKALEQARCQCLKHLQTSKFAASAPRLQQFLRSDAVELIAAIKAKGLSGEIVDRLKDALPHLDAEIKAIAENRAPVASGGGNFWENSI
jgi:Ca-activated chloride channel family protein